MLDAHRLRVFRAVVAAGSVHKAASNLGYTPSAISQQLATLQRETNLQLIERHGRGIEPTATGRLLAEASESALEHLAALDTVVSDLKEGRVGRLTVRYFGSAGAAWIPPVVATLIREFPDLGVDLRLTEIADEKSASPDVDVFVEQAHPEPEPGYDIHHLLEEPYLAVLPHAHRLAGQSSIALRDLADEAWIDNDFSRGPCRQIVLDACSSVGFSPGFHVETHDYPSAIAFVAAGIGITVLPRLGIRSQLPSGLVAVPVVEPVPTRRIAVRVRASLRENPAARRVVELLQDRVDNE
jgi:DNA-binding transcriptional LysR family regulator